MQLHDLTPAPGSTKNRKRVGRGNSSGHGTTSGRGQKGQGSRSGGTKGAGFEGGQTPLAMRLPKLPGFRNPRRIEYTAVNVERLERKFEDGAVIDRAALKAARITKSEFEPVSSPRSSRSRSTRSALLRRPRSRPPAERSSCRAKWS